MVNLFAKASALGTPRVARVEHGRISQFDCAQSWTTQLEGLWSSHELPSLLDSSGLDPCPTADPARIRIAAISGQCPLSAGGPCLHSLLPSTFAPPTLSRMGEVNTRSDLALPGNCLTRPFAVNHVLIHPYHSRGPLLYPSRSFSLHSHFRRFCCVRDASTVCTTRTEVMPKIKTTLEPSRN